jgi:hypothetical protein
MVYLSRRAVLAAVAGATVVPSRAAAIVPVNYDIIPTAGRWDLAASYTNVTNWTNIAYSGNRICYTCHTQNFWGGPYVQAASALIRMCPSGSGQVRLVSLYYDANNKQVFDRTWAPPFQCRPQYSVDNQAADITDHFNAVIVAAPGTLNEFTIEVIGTGAVYMARLEINWAAS